MLSFIVPREWYGKMIEVIAFPIIIFNDSFPVFYQRLKTTVVFCFAGFTEKTGRELA
jgi:hypothetical protein